MAIIDLSHIINPDISVFPGTEKPIFQKIDIEGYRELKMTMFTHTATHIDAPYHIIKNTKSLDELPVGKFYGKAIVLNCKALEGMNITVDFLKQYEGKIKNVEFVLLNSGWSLKWKTEEYFENFPTLTKEAAQWLTQFKLNGIGLDSISLDRVEDLTLPNHHIVLSKEFIIIENLCNLDSLPDSEFIFQCFPLKIEKADGSPVRAIAITNS
jgi:arylformamidase